MPNPLRSAAVLLILCTAASACRDLNDPALGTLLIRTTTTGEDPDSDGYTLLVDEGPTHSIGSSASLHADVIAGNHRLQLEGVAPNCTVTGESPRRATVGTSDTTLVEFVVSCSSASGTVIVVFATIGSFADPDGYLLAVDGALDRPVPLADKQTIRVQEGGHLVELRGVATNCRVQEGLSQTVSVPSAGIDTVTFSIDCSAPPPIAFTRNGHIFLVNADGSGLKNVSPEESDLREPRWSPDGTRIAFGKGYDLWTMNPDGTNRVRLTQSTEGIYDYAWSPDGRSIAFVRDTVRLTSAGVPDSSCSTVCYNPQIWVMLADGANAKRLANGIGPSWSPGSDRLAFVAGFDVYTIRAGGEGLSQITNLPTRAQAVAWSPTGETIAFTASIDPSYPSPDAPPSQDILLVSADGTGLLNLTQRRATYSSPRWSPDGSRIAFGTFADAEQATAEVAVINRDGSGITYLAPNPALDYEPQWSPDGSQILFSRHDNATYGTTRAYVMQSDGTAQTEISSGPAAELDWLLGP